MERAKWCKIFFCNAVGIAIFLSWYLPENHGFWFAIDKSIFYFFNDLLAESQFFLYFTAFVNLRAFDCVAFIAMLWIFYGYYRAADGRGKRYLFCMGLAMLVSAVIVKQCDMHFPISRPSPTLFFPDVNRVGLMTGWPAKDNAGDSFPGDHGMMLLIFCAYMLRYFGIKPFFKCCCVFVVFSLPRIMGGAHWFTDVAVGSVSLVLVVLSWLLLTPAADFFIAFFDKILPRRYFLPKR